jgi:hypothetical protein
MGKERRGRLPQLQLPKLVARLSAGWAYCAVGRWKLQLVERIWWRRVDSNHGPTDYETVALAT